MTMDDEEMPAVPRPDKRGRFPALQYARISLARDLIRERKGAGLSQQQLAGLAGVRQETLSRIETGRHTASPKTVDTDHPGNRNAAAATPRKASGRPAGHRMRLLPGPILPR